MVLVNLEDIRPGPTLPEDFPAHLLLRICDAIIEPLLSPCSPLRPYSKPWSRSTPLPWYTTLDLPKDILEVGKLAGQRDFAAIASSAKGAPVTGCKNDLISFCYINKRTWTICGDRVFQHIRISNLATADILVSRRNYLRDTRVLEFYISREQEASQAQTDLNLSRFFIQAGIILLWSPRIHTVILDIRSIPIDQPVWLSFLNRVRQRLFISSSPTTSPNGRFFSPTIPDIDPTNIVSGSGNELSTSKDATARWGDSQGLLYSPERVSIPNLAFGLSYSAAGQFERGLVGWADSLFAPATRNRVTRQIVPTALDKLTTLDVLVPRPSWGQEESEGREFGLILRRLSGLKRLGLHADGGIQNNSSNYVEFGLIRKPPFGSAVKVEEGDSEEEEADMTVEADGTVIISSHHSHSSKKLSTSTSNGGNVSISFKGSDNAERYDGGYGPETWWAGVLDALTWSPSDVIDVERPQFSFHLAPQSIEELRISVSVPGGTVQISDFDAFYNLVVGYLQRMSPLKTLVFDMAFALQQSDSYTSITRDGVTAMKALYEMQRHYVHRLIDPLVPSRPFEPVIKPEINHNRSPYRPGPRPASYTSKSHPTATRDHAYNRPNSVGPFISNPSTPLQPFASAAQQVIVDSPGQEATEGTTRTPHSLPFANLLEHVFFGEFHGLPPLPPSDWDSDDSMSRLLPEAGGPDHHDRNAFRTMIAESALEANLKETVVGGKDKRNGIRKGAGKGLNQKEGARPALGEIDMRNQRIIPGMWWTVAGPVEAAANHIASGGSGRPTVLDGVIIQGWEEVERSNYHSYASTGVFDEGGESS
ncbi:hypothetical protein CPB86DRAFT_798528 [Serendipita vermifera]|nr:hypothetical protein CPB86DRAFT_798528 [Serendipita vermifera]